jgi:hypothetical protein
MDEAHPAARVDAVERDDSRLLKKFGSTRHRTSWRLPDGSKSAV